MDDDFRVREVPAFMRVFSVGSGSPLQLREVTQQIDCGSRF